VSNAHISREIIKSNEEAQDFKSMKVLVSRKTKKLIEQGDITQDGRRFIITDKGDMRVSMNSFVMTNFRPTQKTFNNIHVSFANPSGITPIIGENREIDKAFRKIDELVGKENTVILIRPKKATTET
jgi:hypothetical protein